MLLITTPTSFSGAITLYIGVDHSTIIYVNVNVESVGRS